MVRLWCVLMIAAATLSGCGHDYEGYKYRPYTVRGVHYVPMQPDEAPGYVEEGIASHYKESWLIFPGKTAIGENCWDWSSSGAHKTLPLPCKVRVTNLSNGRKTVIRLNDRGPFIAGRNLDVTAPVAKKLGFYDAGLATVRIEVLSVGDGSYRIKKARRQPPVRVALPVDSDVALTPFQEYGG